jgi:hypothetical protein
MPRAQRTAAYGPEYEQLLLQAHSKAANGHAVPFESTAQARSLQFRVYAYFTALRKEALRPDLIKLSEELSMRVEGNNLCFFRKEDSWDAIAIRNALGLEKGFAELGGTQVAIAAPAKEAMLDKLTELRKGKK